MKKKNIFWFLGFGMLVLLITAVYSAIAPTFVKASPATVEVRVSASNDDAEEANNGSVNLTSSDLELVTDTQGIQTVGIRFADLNVPPQATITAAYIQFQVDETDSGVAPMTIAGQADDDAAAFTSNNRNISDRITTSTTVSWSPPDWNTIGQSGIDQQTPDLTAIVQEIINKPGWAYGNAMVFIITGSGTRTAESYNGMPEASPLLHIEYTGGIFPTETPSPTPLPPGINYRFAVIGDYGNDSLDEARVATMVANWDPDFIITLGDNNYSEGAATTIDLNIGQFYSQFIGNYQGQYGSGSPTNRFWPSLGNHDWHSLTCDTNGCTGPYFDYFTLPGNERYYDIDFGLVHLFAVDSFTLEPDGNDLGGPQSMWLQNVLTASTSCFKVVYFHHAPYSTGEHGSYADMQWPFADWGADVVMTGHDHDYERLDVNGVPYIVNGIGGKANDPFTNIGNLPAGVTSVVRYNEDAGAMLVTVTETGMSMQMYNANDILVDTYHINRSCNTGPTATATNTPSPSATSTTSPTVTFTNTPLPTDTSIPTPTPTVTDTPLPTDTPTPTPIPTNTSTASPTPTATNSPLPTDTPTEPTDTPTPTITATVIPGAFHISDLDGLSESLPGGIWAAHVLIEVHDNAHVPLANVTVNVTWTDGASGYNSCLTDSNGRCTLTFNDVIKRNKTVTLTVISAVNLNGFYQPSNNHDSENDSNGTVITISR